MQPNFIFASSLFNSKNAAIITNNKSMLNIKKPEMFYEEIL